MKSWIKHFTTTKSQKYDFNAQISLSSLKHLISETPAYFWMLGSILLGYYFFFIVPVFLNPESTMHFFAYIPAESPIGLDLRQIIDFANSFLNKEPFMYGNVYPPLFTLLITPFASINPTPLYRVLTTINLLSYILVTLVIPAKISPVEKNLPVILVFFLTGLFSYGLQFEIERGQFNIIAYQLALAGVYLFHFKPKYRFFAYGLLSIGIQIKIYPAIYILMFIDNWKNWKTSVPRILGVGIFNVLLLFILGYKQLINFISAIRNIQISYIWIGNHSIRSFVTLLHSGTFAEAFSKLRLNYVHTWLTNNVMIINWLLITIVFWCFTLVILDTIQQNKKGFNANIFVISTLVAILVPAISNDYTLSLLPSALGIFFCAHNSPSLSENRYIPKIFMISVATFAYSSVLFSYTNKPLILQNNLPALIIILFSLTTVTLFSKPTPIPE